MGNPKKYFDKTLDIGFASVQSFNIVKISSEKYRVTVSLIRDDSQSFVFESLLIRLTAKRMFSTYFETSNRASFVPYWIEPPNESPGFSPINREDDFEKKCGSP